jgi:hypothetical protein
MDAKTNMIEIKRPPSFALFLSLIIDQLGHISPLSLSPTFVVSFRVMSIGVPSTQSSRTVLVPTLTSLRTLNILWHGPCQNELTPAHLHQSIPSHFSSRLPHQPSIHCPNCGVLGYSPGMCKSLIVPAVVVRSGTGFVATCPPSSSPPAADGRRVGIFWEEPAPSLTLPVLVGTVERLPVSPCEEEAGRGLGFVDVMGDIAVPASVMIGAEDVPWAGTAVACSISAVTVSACCCCCCCCCSGDLL